MFFHLLRYFRYWRPRPVGQWGISFFMLDLAYLFVVGLVFRHFPFQSANKLAVCRGYTSSPVFNCLLEGVCDTTNSSAGKSDFMRVCFCRCVMYLGVSQPYSWTLKSLLKVTLLTMDQRVTTLKHFAEMMVSQAAANDQTTMVKDWTMCLSSTMRPSHQGAQLSRLLCLTALAEPKTQHHVKPKEVQELRE